MDNDSLTICHVTCCAAVDSPEYLLSFLYAASDALAPGHWIAHKVVRGADFNSRPQTSMKTLLVINIVSQLFCSSSGFLSPDLLHMRYHMNRHTKSGAGSSPFVV